MQLRTMFLAGLLAVPACSKANDLPVLQEEATAIVKYNRPKLDAFQRRLDAVTQKAGDNLPNAQGVADLTVEVRKNLGELRETERSVEATAASLAKEGKAQELANLVDKTEKAFEENSIVINDDLNALEGLVSRAEAKRSGSAPAAPAAPAEPAPADPAPADPSR
jgi:hypothetical protein